MVTICPSPRSFLGSISDYVLHNASRTVAIIRQPESHQAHDALASSGLSRKIVIAIDQSKQAFNAFKWALHNFCNESDKVIIYHVHHPTALPVTAMGTGEFGMEEVFVPEELMEKFDVKALNASEHLVGKYMRYASEETKPELFLSMNDLGMNMERWLLAGLINLTPKVFYRGKVVDTRLISEVPTGVTPWPCRLNKVAFHQKECTLMLFYEGMLKYLMDCVTCAGLNSSIPN
eukprot:Gb_22308 [translate_table: standard]